MPVARAVEAAGGVRSRSVPAPDLRSVGVGGVRFADPDVERAYLLFHGRRAAAFVRLGAVGVGFAWLMACSTVWLLRPEHLLAFVGVLLLAQAPPVVWMVWATGEESRYRWIVPSSVVSVVIGTVISLGVCTWVYEDQGTAIGALIICAYFVPLLRIPTVIGLAQSALLGAFYLLFVWLGQEVNQLTPATQALYSSLWCTSTAVSLGLTYVMDVDSRRAFVDQETISWQRAQVAAEKARAETLLLNILPGPVAERLKAGDLVIADSVADVTVLFLDIVGFTAFATERSPSEVVEVLNELFTAIDGIAERHGVEKIKTIGDAYMAVAGLPLPRPDHADAVAEFALDLQAWMRESRLASGRLHIRIGMFSGAVVAGVIGRSKFAYDLWGDTVNSAARMEAHGIEDEIQIGAPTRALLGDRYVVEDRGEIEVKGKGPMHAYLLRGRAGGPLTSGS
jgi:class 3 adenylate cyclase